MSRERLSTRKAADDQGEYIAVLADGNEVAQLRRAGGTAEPANQWSLTSAGVLELGGVLTFMAGDESEAARRATESLTKIFEEERGRGPREGGTDER